MPQFASDLGGILNNIAMIDLGAKRFDAARGRLRRAIVLQRKALAADRGNRTYRQFLQSHLGNLVQAAREERDLKEAVALLRELISEYPDIPRLASDLGEALGNLAVMDLRSKRLEAACVGLREAAIWQRKAMAAMPAHPGPRYRLIEHLENLRRAASGLGLAEESNQALRELHALRSSDPETVALNARLAAVLKGLDKPKDNADRLVLAYQAAANLMYAASSRLFAEAFAIDPKVAANLPGASRYNAACSAARAGRGEGKDDPMPDAAARAKFRRQGLEWLKADLSAWSKVLEGGRTQDRELVATRMVHWKGDSDLAGIRDKDELAKLPEEERRAFEALWSEVNRLLCLATAKK